VTNGAGTDAANTDWTLVETHMRNLMRQAWRVLRALHKDQQGANMVEYILIIAAISLPLIAVVLYYRNEIADWAKEKWDAARGIQDPARPTTP
jgi:Flp pilus assembly pilin Flp